MFKTISEMERSSSDTGAHHLGWRRLKNKSSQKINLQVKIQSQKEPQSLSTLFMTYLITSFPKFLSSSIKIPQFFMYKPEKSIHGFLKLGSQKNVSESWIETMEGQRGEEKVFNALNNAFKYRPSLMLQGFELRNMLRLAKEQQQQDSSAPSQSYLPLTSFEMELGSILNIDLDQIDRDANEMLEHFLEDPNIQTIDHSTMQVLHINVNAKHQKNKKDIKTIDTLIKKTEPNTNKEISNKCDLENTKSELKKMDKIYEDSSKIIANLLKQKQTFTIKDIRNAAIRFLFNTRLQDNQEFDTLVVDKENKTFFHFETKVQNKGKDKCKESRLKSLRNLIKGACEQIKRGKHLLENVLTRGITLSGWTKIGFVCLPDLKDKALLLELGIEERFLTYFLTDAELNSIDFLSFLLAHSDEKEKSSVGENDSGDHKNSEKEVDGEQAPNEMSQLTLDEMTARATNDTEYTNLLAWLIGALNCTINCQTFNHNTDLEQVTKEVTGNWQDGVKEDIDIQNCCRKCTNTDIPAMVG